MRAELKRAVKQAAEKLYGSHLEPELSRPAEQFGDYATNAALQLAKSAAKTPQEIARALVAELENTPGVASVSLAGPGFINFRLTDEAIARAALQATDLPQPNRGREILVEFGDPNPFKEMHIGHLYSYIVGDAIASLLEASGATVRRLSYHGDVGRHVAMAIYGLQELQKEREDKKIPTNQVGNFLFVAYTYGYDKYEKEPEARREIEIINRHVYDHDDPAISQLHQKGVELSFEHFDKILDLLSISTDKRYFESQSSPIGLQVVKDNIGKVFTESQGAVVFEGEKAGLHTRVFITSKGLPTYETKDLGLVRLKDRDFPEADRSIVITANEQSEYFKVMLAALAEIDAPLAHKTTHMAHGFVNLSTGKMSSRTGQVYPAAELVQEVETAAKQQFPNAEPASQTAVAALRYDFLKSRLGGNITFDIKESVNLEGNSGPYLQYAHARACGILSKAQSVDGRQRTLDNLDENERSLARKIGEYPETVEKAVNELMPHHICTYLYELAQVFNSFYETSRIIGDGREAQRLQLVRAYQQVLQDGLNLLNIAAPEKI